MKFSKYCVGLLIFLTMAIEKTESNGVEKDVLNTTLQELFDLVATNVTTVRLEQLPFSGLGLIYLAFLKFSDKNDNPIKEYNQSTLDMLMFHQMILNETKNINKHIEKESYISRKLSFDVESFPFLEKIRVALQITLGRQYTAHIKNILDSTVSLEHKNLYTYLNFNSEHRVALRSFVSNFIQPSFTLTTTGPVKLFFEYLLEKQRLLTLNNIDCDPDSLHSTMFESFLDFAKEITNGYVLLITAHVLQYQNDIKIGRLSDAATDKMLSEQLINEYKNDMKILVEKTKWALKKAPRDIKNCGKFTNFTKGIDYERISFVETLPMIRYLPMASDTYTCSLPTELNVNRTVYETGMCDTYIDRPPISLSIYKNSDEPDRQFKYMVVHSSKKADEIFGRGNSDFTTEIPYKTKARCNTIFCIAFKNNAVAISTERVRAKPGNVITGLRFRIRKNIVYIDIQQGTYFDPVTIKSNSVFWTETPESSQVQYLNSNIRGIELGDFEVDDNSFLTTIQLQVALRPGDGLHYRMYNEQIL